MPKELTQHYHNHAGGLNVKSSPLAMPLEDSPDLLNVSLTQTGAIGKRTGWEHYSTTPAGNAIPGLIYVNSIFRLTKKAGAEYTIAWGGSTAAGGGFFYGETPHNVFTTVLWPVATHQSRYWLGEAYNDNLYLANGYDPPRVYHGGFGPGCMNNLADEVGASLPAAWVGTDQPCGIVLTHHDRVERMCAWGVASDPSRVWFSDVQDPIEWNTGSAYNILVLNDNGEPVTAVVPLYERTLIFKKTQVALYIGDEPDNTYLDSVYPIGTEAPRSIIQVGRDLYCWSNRGPVQASGIESYGDVNPVNIATKIEPFLNNVNWSRADLIFAWHNKRESQVIWSVPRSGGDLDRLLFVYHYALNAWVIWDNINAQCACIYDETAGEPHVLLGGATGYVEHLTDAYSDNGLAYTSRWVSPWYDLGDYTRRKRIHRAEMACEGDGFEVDIYEQWDFETDWFHVGNLQHLLPDGVALWNGVVWGFFEWGAGQVGTVHYIPQGSGKVYRLKLENTTANTSFLVHGWSFADYARAHR